MKTTLCITTPTRVAVYSSLADTSIKISANRYPKKKNID